MKTEVIHEHGDWIVFVDGNAKFGFIYREEAEAVAEMIDALIEAERVLSEYYATDHEGSFYTRSVLDQTRQALTKAGCYEE